MASSSKLTPKQKRFVEEYQIDLNAKQAAIRAGYSKKTAQEQGSRLLSNVKVSEAVAEACAKRSAEAGLSADRVLQELACIAFSDLRNCLTAGGNLLNPQDWDDNTAAAISSIEVVSNSRGVKDENGCEEIEYVHKIKTWDKNAALEKLGKYFALFVDRTENVNHHYTISESPLTEEEWAERHGKPH